MKKLAVLLIAIACFAQLGTARTNNSFDSHKKKSHTIFKQWLPQFHKTHKFTLPVIVYGPKEFERSKGTPKTEVDTFSLKGNSSAPYTMVVTNAFCDDKEVTSATIKLNGVQIFGPSDFKRKKPLLIKTVTLTQSNTITVKIAGKPGTHLLITILGKRSQQTDTTPPTLALTSPTDGLITRDSSILVSGTATDTSAVSVTINGEDAVVGAGGEFSEEVLLAEGTNLISVVATDASNNTSAATRTVIKDATPPELVVDNAQYSTTNAQISIISGTVSDLTATTVTVNGSSVPITNGAFSTQVSLTEGLNEITIIATDAAGNSSPAARMVRKDALPPVVVVSGTTEGMITNQTSVQINGSANDSTAVTVTVNGTTVPVEGRTFTYTAPLVEGSNTITIVVTDGAGNSTTVTRVVRRDTEPPQLAVNNPQEGSVVSSQTSEVSGTVVDSTITTVVINGDTASVVNNAFTQSVTFMEGTNTITITATDAAGNTASITRTVILDTTNPALTVTLPPDNSVTNQTPIEISGTVVDSTAVIVTVNGNSVPVTNGSFNMLYTLAEGLHSFSIIATDAASNGSTETRTVRLDTQAPILSNILPENGIETRITPAVISGIITDSISFSLVANGDSVSVNQDGSFHYQISLLEGSNTVTLVATDEVGNTSTGIRTINFTTLPPDPIVVAPPLDTTVTTNPYDATKFIYAGPDTIQKGVAPGTIVATRVAIIRGKVLANCGIPLSGVNISILSHPEFGYTQSRADGMFDMVVNGGGLLTLKYSKSGFLPAQRQIATPWLDYISADSIMMIAVDPNVTTVASNIDSVQSAQTSVVSDADGTRRATIIFERFTQGTMTYFDGTTEPLSTLDLRGTEYGSASECVKVLPGTLPPQSALGYGIELNCDEAINANAKLVSFDKPFALYVDNFLTLPAGSRVPAAYFDSTKGIWMPFNNGRVVKIISIIDGAANLDVTGSGSVSPQSSYDSLGITLDERTQLAALFTAGQSFMRIEANRLGPWSFSWPFGPPVTAKWPSLPAPTKQMLDKDCTTSGSIIGIQNQSLGETLPITGTPFSIFYKSTRVPGRADAFSLDIPLTGATLPPGLNRIYLEVSVAGQFFSYTFLPSPNLSYNFVWNGNDAYGRRVQGKQTISTSIGYNYQANFQIPTQGLSFGSTSGYSLNRRRSYTTTTLWQYWSGLIGMWDETSRNLGGWSLNIHHLYDAVGKTLHYGDGNSRSAENANLVVNAFAGYGVSGSDSAKMPALQARLNPTAVTVALDGDVLIANGAYILKVGTDGIMHRIAGIAGAGYGYNGDTLPALQTKFAGITAMSIGPDGSIYVADVGNHRVRKISNNGIVTTVAGTGAYPAQGSFSGDGGLAVNAQLNSPGGVVVGPDGSVYIGDAGNYRIRRVNPSGIITSIGGNGGSFPFYDNTPVLAVQLGLVDRLAIGPDGSLYYGTHQHDRLRRISPDGIIRTVAGTGFEDFSGDCGPGINARIQGPLTLAADKKGNVVFYTRGIGARDTRIRKLSSGGIISTIAGTGVDGFNGNGLPATASKVHHPRDFAFAPDGSIYFCEGGKSTDDIPTWTQGQGYSVRKISKPFPQFSLNTNVIPSEDGSELFVFDYSGRHQQTVDALTGVVKYDFYYDNKGRLTNIRGIDSLFTTLERDSVTGEATAIISPYGQKTYLYINNSSYLDSLTNPARETQRFTYDGGGLMKTMRNAKNQLYKFTYDSLGRLIKDEDPLGGFKALSRTEIYDNGCSSCGKIGFEVTMTTALGKKSSYRVERVTPGILVTQTDENGQKTYTRENPDGTTTITSPDSTVVTVTAGPDPRFGMMVPVDKNKITRKPSGLTMTESHGRKISQMTGLQVTGLTDSSFVNGRLSKSEYNGTTRTITSTSPLGRKKVSFLDVKGRVIKDSIPGIMPTVNVYNSKGQLIETKQGSRVTTFAYDNVGRLASIQDPMLRVSNTVYDSVGRTLQQILTDGRNIGYSYDRNGNMVSLTPPSRPAHEFDYNDIDLDKTYSPPELPVDGFTSTHYEYNLDKQNTLITRPDSTTITFEYDSAKSQLQSISFDRGETHYQYNATSGLMTRLISPTSDTLLFTYDGSSMTKEEWLGVVKGSVVSRLDNNFRVITQTINGTDSITYLYNNDDQPTQIGALKLVYNTSNDQLLSDTIGSTTTSYSYSSFGELSGLQSKYSGSQLFATSYTRDSLGRIRALNETVQGENKVYRYGYDVAGRLEKVWRNDTLVSQYVYDSTGNRLVKITPSSSDSGTYDVQDRMLSYGTANYIYTKNGELQFKIEGADTTRYTYDGFGNLITVLLPGGNRIEYVIDGQNRRIGKKINDTIVARWIYEGQLRPVAEVDSAGNIVARYVYGMKPNIPEYILKSGTTYRVVTDHLGSVRLIVDAATGTVTQRMDYDEFGNILVDSHPGFSPFAFAGGLYDTQTKLVRFGARDYDASAGRWTAKDPILFEGGDVNLFGYIMNDPVNKNDVEGKTGEELDWSLGRGKAVAGAIIGTALAYMVDAAIERFGEGPFSNALQVLKAGILVYSAMEAATYAIQGFAISMSNPAVVTSAGQFTAFVLGTGASILAVSNLMDAFEVLNRVVNKYSGKK